MTNALTLGGLNLRDATKYVVESYDLGMPNLATNQRTQTLTITIHGSTPDDLVTNQSAILDVLRAAERASAPNSGRDPITLVTQPNTSEPVAFDVLVDASGRAGMLAVGAPAYSTVALKYMRAAVLTLTTAAYGRGDRLVATNLLLDSGDLSTDSWTATNTTVTADAAVAPNGDTQACKILETTTNGFHAVKQSVTKAAAATNYVYTGYVKGISRDYVDLQLQDSTGSNGVTIGLKLDGTVNFVATASGTGFTAVDGGIVAANHDYYRVWVAGESNSDTTITGTLLLRSDASTTEYTGDTAKGVYAWGFSLQPGATQPGPYLETGDSLTLINGTNNDLYLFDVPGDTYALPRLTVSDVSTNDVVINDLRWGQQPVEFAGDFQSVIPITPAAGASSTDDDAVSTTIGMLPANATPQTLGTFTKPSTAPYCDGELAGWLRGRDTAAAIGQPTNLAATQSAFGIVASGVQVTGTAATSATVTHTDATDGNTQVVIVVTPSATHTTPSGWTLDKSVTKSGVGRISVFSRIASSDTGSTTVAFGSSTKSALYYYEITGAAASSPTDQTASASGTGTIGGRVGGLTVSPVYAITGTTGTTAQANELAFAVILHNTFDNPGPWSNEFDGIAIINGADVTGCIATKSLSATGTYAADYQPYGGGGPGKHVGDHFDYAGLIVTYKGAVTTAPDLPSAAYTASVALVDAAGNVGPASEPLTISGSKAFRFTWDAPSLGIADHYRLFWDRPGVAGQSIDTDDDTTSYTLTTETGSGANVPNTDSAIFGQFRASVSLPSGTVGTPGPGRYTTVANGQWELVKLGILPGTTQAADWGGDALGWAVSIDESHSTTGNSMAADCLFVLPLHQPASHWVYLGSGSTIGGLTTSRDWRYDLRPDLVSSRLLYETGTSTEAGHFVGEGEYLISNGAVVLCWQALVGGDVSDVSSCAITISLELTPRYLYLAS